MNTYRQIYPVPHYPVKTDCCVLIKPPSYPTFTFDPINNSKTPMNKNYIPNALKADRETQRPLHPQRQ